MQAVIPVIAPAGFGHDYQHFQRCRTHPAPFHAAYSATKFALNAIGKAAGVELKKDGIRVLDRLSGLRAHRLARTPCRARN